jgi:hypothetical protein
MTKRVFALVASALIIVASASIISFGFVRMASAYDDWQEDVTVLTIAPDGTWGVGTDAFISRAIARAVANCKRKYQGTIGCGHRLTSIRAGWSLAFRCGNENIIVADRSLADAEQLARRQEHDLRTNYVPDMAPCVRTVTVDPRGAIVAPTVGYSAAP